MFSLVRSWLPEGRLLTEEVFDRRHAWIVQLCLLQAVTLGLVIATLGHGPARAVLGAAVVAVPALVARSPRVGRGVRTAASAASLTLSAVVLVHTFPGVIETHFHFFVMVAVAALYQDWTAFLVALVITVVHHAVLGTIDAGTVFGAGHAGMHHGATGPLFWALVHGAFVLAASCAHLASWRLNEQQSLHDPLTGVANRLLLTESLHRMLARGGEVAVLFIDLDDFKDVNDGRGHAAGDQLLCTVADRLVASVRSGDVVARLGGDEFAIAHDGSADTARSVAERILAALAAPTVVEGRPLVVHASVGVADVASAGNRKVETLLRNADLAMYQAKAGGKGRLAVYAEGMALQARCRAELAEDLAAALAAGDQLEVHYQDIVTLPEAHVVGVEALLRWHHPTRGAVSPVDFIPLAEENGSIVPIGTWVLHQSVRHVAALSAQVGHALTVSVNVSGRQLREPDFVDVVSTALATAGLPAGQLVLEVTESVLVDDVAAVVERLARLRAIGVKVAIDDFGTGYSSLSYLRQLPADRIKIDRSFVADLGSGGAAATLVATIIELAGSLGLDVVAEGVETDDQRTQLTALHCTHGQGWLFGRPSAPATHPAPSTSTSTPALRG
ncbi:EAL domain-containing protein [Klenkia sp. PcliD-1-E]|uniref:putative bifunctional diguanylate cyclase/phosphodiesterase n=1 Tax=Klenkia sp. PcliD-1-E TaxID=2954492 RepID=UPI002097E755|nr:EAL domain-containing protein [Klenkia sp. PcliD-1-E]MCO7221235.1 bifunctional diguanylate cyclase/phosphodiesterase [Klenkia sp. PcliD-1-E]